MHRTEGANFVTGVAGNEFTNGPPGTTLEKNWLNATQEELLYVIEQAGLTAKLASTETSTQLKAAMDLLYVSLSGGANVGDVAISGAMTMPRNANLVVQDAGTDTATITADFLTVFNSSNLGVVLDTVSVTVDLSGSAANGLDTGAVATGTWYYLYVIYNGTTISALASLAKTTPTELPSGYTFYKFVGAVYTDGSSNVTPFLQVGNKVHWKTVAWNDTAFTTTNYTAQTKPTVHPPYGGGVSGLIISFFFSTSNDTGYISLDGTNVFNQIFVVTGGREAVVMQIPVYTGGSWYMKVGSGTMWANYIGFILDAI